MIDSRRKLNAKKNVVERVIDRVRTESDMAVEAVKSLSISVVAKDLRNGFSRIVRSIIGDLWYASSADGAGLGKLVEHNAELAMSKPRHVGSMRFLHKKAHVVQEESDVQQLMQFNEDKSIGEDTVGVFAKVFGDGNIFDSPTDSLDWTEQRRDFLHNVTTGKSLNNMIGPMHRIAAGYMDELSESKAQTIEDLEDFTTRYTMDILAKTQLGFLHISADAKKALAPIINAAIVIIANPKNSIAATLPSFLAKGWEWFDYVASGLKSLDSTMEPGFKILAEMFKLNQNNIIATDNWLTSVSIKKNWCRKRAEEIAHVKLVDKKAKAAWYKEIYKEKWFEDIVNVEWPEALAKCRDELARNVPEKEQAKTTRDILAVLHSRVVHNDAALFLVVGHETSAKFFQYAITLLADKKHESKLEKFRTEIWEYAANNNRSPENFTKSDLDNLIYANAVQLESLRMFPPVPMLKQQLNKDLILRDMGVCRNRAEYEEKMKANLLGKDIRIAQGDFVFFSTKQSHRLESNYGKDANEFNPERFIEKDGSGQDMLKTPNPNAWYPFGFGRRLCLGQRMTKQEVMLGLIHLFTRFNVVVDDPLRYRTLPIFTLRPEFRVSAKISELDRSQRSTLKMG